LKFSTTIICTLLVISLLKPSLLAGREEYVLFLSNSPSAKCIVNGEALIQNESYDNFPETSGKWYGVYVSLQEDLSMVCLERSIKR